MEESSNLYDLAPPPNNVLQSNPRHRKEEDELAKLTPAERQNLENNKVYSRRHVIKTKEDNVNHAKKALELKSELECWKQKIEWLLVQSGNDPKSCQKINRFMENELKENGISILDKLSQEQDRGNLKYIERLKQEAAGECTDSQKSRTFKKTLSRSMQCEIKKLETEIAAIKNTIQSFWGKPSEIPIPATVRHTPRNDQQVPSDEIGKLKTFAKAVIELPVLLESERKKYLESKNDLLNFYANNFLKNDKGREYASFEKFQHDLENKLIAESKQFRVFNKFITMSDLIEGIAQLNLNQDGPPQHTRVISAHLILMKKKSESRWKWFEEVSKINTAEGASQRSGSIGTQRSAAFAESVYYDLLYRMVHHEAEMAKIEAWEQLIRKHYKILQTKLTNRKKRGSEQVHPEYQEETGHDQAEKRLRICQEGEQYAQNHAGYSFGSGHSFPNQNFQYDTFPSPALDCMGYNPAGTPQMHGSYNQHDTSAFLPPTPMCVRQQLSGNTVHQQPFYQPNSQNCQQGYYGSTESFHNVPTDHHDQATKRTRMGQDGEQPVKGQMQYLDYLSPTSFLSAPQSVQATSPSDPQSFHQQQNMGHPIHTYQLPFPQMALQNYQQGGGYDGPIDQLYNVQTYHQCDQEIVFTPDPENQKHKESENSHWNATQDGCETYTLAVNTHGTSFDEETNQSQKYCVDSRSMTNIRREFNRLCETQMPEELLSPPPIMNHDMPQNADTNVTSGLDSSQSTPLQHYQQISPEVQALQKRYDELKSRNDEEVSKLVEKDKPFFVRKCGSLENFEKHLENKKNTARQMTLSKLEHVDNVFANVLKAVFPRYLTLKGFDVLIKFLEKNVETKNAITMNGVVYPVEKLELTLLKLKVWLEEHIEAELPRIFEKLCQEEQPDCYP